MDHRFKAIVSGFKNYVFPNKEIEELALKRATVCAICPFAVETKMKQLLPDDTIKEIDGLKCSDCGCILSAKVRQIFESCPQNKW
jgi:aspartate carbamoyltransferase regulatory subunit